MKVGVFLNLLNNKIFELVVEFRNLIRPQKVVVGGIVSVMLMGYK